MWFGAGEERRGEREGESDRERDKIEKEEKITKMSNRFFMLVIIIINLITYANSQSSLEADFEFQDDLE